MPFVAAEVVADSGSSTSDDSDPEEHGSGSMPEDSDACALRSAVGSDAHMMTKTMLQQVTRAIHAYALPVVSNVLWCMLPRFITCPSMKLPSSWVWV